jgi:hypothetical protein
MHIRKPKWQLVKLCPVCEQGSALTLVACPECRHVSATCDEEGSVFPDARAIGVLEVVERKTDCPACGNVSLGEFRLASDDEIQAAGFTPDEYR